MLHMKRTTFCMLILSICFTVNPLFCENSEVIKPLLCKTPPVIDANLDDGLRSSRSLRQSIKRAADQLEGGILGIVAVHYADPIADFESLSPSNTPMLCEMARIMHPWQHVAAIMLSSEADVQLPESRGLGQVRSYVKEGHEFASLLGERVLGA